MPLPLLNKFKVAHRLINTKWPSFLNKVNSLFLNNTFLAPIMDSLLIKRNQPISLDKLRNGPRLISELELPLITQTRTRLSSLTERNTPTRHLLLLQGSTTVITMLKDFQK